jgi:transposase
MGHISGRSRYQAKIVSLDEYVSPDSTARSIDRFVDGLDFLSLGFQKAIPNERGRDSYDPRCLAKLLIYGYESGIRSSRKLEALTHINIEAMWLMDELSPDFKTIADFRKDNIDALAGLLDEYNSFAEYCGLFGKNTVAIDGTKIKASNSKKNNHSKKKIEQNIKYSRGKAKEYLEALAAADDMDEASGLAVKAESYEKKAEGHEAMLERLNASGETEMSVIDPDARMMSNGNGGTIVAYNVQAAVDVDSHLACGTIVSQNPTDHGQLAEMSEKTQEAFRKKDVTVLADKGYYGHEDFEACESLGVTAIVAKQQRPGEKKGGKYSIGKFRYDKEADAYVCPEGRTLAAHSVSKTKRRRFFDKAACMSCPAKGECLNGKERFRQISRQPYRDILDRFEKTYAENAKLYKLRQETVEHVFGTIKRTMNGSYFLLRSKEKVRAEASLLFLGYNIKRTKTLLGTERMVKLMDEYFELLSQRTIGQLSFYLRSLCRLILSRAVFRMNRGTLFHTL